MNWEQRIIIATIKDEFTNDDMVKARRWNTCSVGEKLSIRNTIHHYDLEKNTIRLGVKFSRAVLSHDVSQAATTHKQIQALKKTEMLKEFNYAY